MITRILFISIFFPIALFAQVSGRVGEGSGQPLSGVSLHWQNSSTGTSSDSTGHFEIAEPVSYPAVLIIKQIGFVPDSLNLSVKPSSPLNIKLKAADIIQKGVVIEGRQKSGVIDTYKPINGELITSKGLLKAACCNLSESFETNPSVDAAMTDAVSGARKIQMLGLDGVYAQILNENLPLIRGLSGAYGLSSIPGTWLNSILITKGTGSVVNGYESISGQINLDLHKPSRLKDRFFANFYINQRQRAELNLHGGKKFDDYSGTMYFIHGNMQQMKMDRNNDGFLDMPQIRQLNGMNRWDWHHRDRIEGQINFRAFAEERTAGQGGHEHHTGTQIPYNISVNTHQAEFSAKTGFLFPEKPYQSIGTMFSARYHDQSMLFGLKKYFGVQRSLYGNAIFQSIFRDTDHIWKTGLSYVLDDYREGYNDSAFTRTESVPGIFFEYTGHFTDKFSVVSGVRADAHNLYGVKVSPRLHLKYDPKENWTIRASGGRGFRTANVITENIAVFASSRTLSVPKALLPEIAWNYGGSITRKFKIRKRDGTINVDFFRTDFENQVVVNLEDPHRIVFENLNGKSFANSLQTDLAVEAFDRFDVLASWKWYDVQSTYDGKLLQRPLQPRQRVLLNLAYATNFDRWKFDLTAKYFGNARVPASALNAGYQSPSFMLLMGQVTKKFRWFDLYLGGENILDYRQSNPIIDPQNPFGPNFDASLTWAPVDGRIIYLGFRTNIEYKEKE